MLKVISVAGAISDGVVVLWRNSKQFRVWGFTRLRWKSVSIRAGGQTNNSLTFVVLKSIEPHSMVIPRSRSSLPLSMLQAYLNEALPIAEDPVSFFFISSLGTTPNKSERWPTSVDLPVSTCPQTAKVTAGLMALMLMERVMIA